MKIIPLLLAAYLSSLPIVSTAISADDVLSGEWILLGPQGLPIGKMTITQIGDRLSVSGPGWKGTGSFDGKAGYYDWTFLNGASGRTTITFDDQTKILQGTVKGTGINLVYNGQKVEVEKRERRSIGQTPTSSIRAPGKSTTQPKTAEKVDGPEIVGKNVFRNLTCESLPHYGAVFMYVDETTDLAEPQIAHEMLAVAAEYVKKYCPHVRGYRNISVAINFKSKLNEKLYPYNSSISARNYDEDKLIWQEYSNRETVKRQQEEAAREAERQREIWQREQDRQQLARQQMIQAIQDKLAAFLKSSGVSTTPTLSTLTSNPSYLKAKR